MLWHWSVNGSGWLEGRTAGHGRWRQDWSACWRDRCTRIWSWTGTGAVRLCRSRRLEPGVTGGCGGGPPGRGEFTVAVCCSRRGRLPHPSSVPADSISALVLGSKRGASDGRCRAAAGDVRRMNWLVRLHVATVSYRLNSYGMQEVWGSNPHSSTSQLRSANSNGRREAAFCFGRTCRRQPGHARAQMGRSMLVR